MKFNLFDEIKLKQKYEEVYSHFKGKIYIVLGDEQDTKPTATDKILVRRKGSNRITWVDANLFEKV